MAGSVSLFPGKGEEGYGRQSWVWLGRGHPCGTGVPGSLALPMIFLHPGCLGALALFDSCWVSSALHVMWYTVGAQ